MTINIAVAPDPLSAIPRMQINVTTTNTAPFPVNPSEFVTIMRQDPDGRQRKVILEAGAQLSGGVWSGFDYHAPFNQTVSYMVVLGTQSAQSIVGTGYWDYAPQPNLLPSNVVALGRAGDPVVDGGWSNADSPFATVTVGNGRWAGAMLVTDFTQPNFDVFNACALEAGATGLHWVVADIENLTSSTVSYVLAVGFYNNAACTGPPLVTGSGANTFSPATRGLVTCAVTRPVGALGVKVTVGALSPAELGLWGITIQPSASGTTIPLPIFTTAMVNAEISSTVPWLVHPINPALSTAVDAISAIGDQTRAGTATNFTPWGARYPVPVGEGIRRARAGQLEVRVNSKEQLQAVDSLLDDGGPILVNLAGPDMGADWWDMDWAWIQPGDITYANPGAWTKYPFRHTIIPFTVIDTPAGSTQPLWTWADVVATFATWADFSAAYATWADAAVNRRIS